MASTRLTLSLVWIVRLLLAAAIVGLIWASWLPAIRDERSQDPPRPRRFR